MKRSPKILAAVLALMLALVVAACADGDVLGDPFSPEAFGETEYENGYLLVDTEWLNDNKDDDRVVILDVRRNVEDYLEGHIPGAVHFDRGNIQGDPEAEFAGILVGPEHFQEEARRAGINDDSVVVIYDESRGSGAARVFWGFDVYGHWDGGIRILNGGFAAWEEAGLETSTEPPTVEEGNFTAELREDLAALWSADDVVEIIEDENYLLFDARTVEEYIGEDVRADRGGHIPGAVNLDWPLVLEDEGVPYWRAAEEIEALYAEVGLERGKTIVPYCQTNVRAAHAYFTLRLLGYDTIPFEGSWAEYGNTDGLPIDTVDPGEGEEEAS